MVTFKNSPLTLVGRSLKIGNRAPDFSVTSSDLKEVALSSFEGKLKIITSFPSLDTEVCDLQLKEFNRRATGISKDVVIIAISKDLPFAEKRFCSNFKIENINVFSDYKNASFGINYGLLIKEFNLLARAVLILDKNNVLRYMQIVEELTNSPNYDEVFRSLEGVFEPILEGSGSRCLPCEGIGKSLDKEMVDKLMGGIKGWTLIEDRKIVKEYKFKNFLESKWFLDVVAVIAETEGHHPSITINYSKVIISLTTHVAKGLTENDFIMAKIIDEVYPN